MLTLQKFNCLSSLVLFCFTFFNVSAQTERRGEIALFAGGAYLLGEVNKIPFYSTRPAFGAFYRHTINERYNITGMFTYGKLSASTNPTNFVFPVENALPFNRSIYELTGIAEYNFRRFLIAYKKTKYTPYVYLGAGLTYYPDGEISFVPVVPFGVGFKYNWFKNFSVGTQIGMRKTFTDKLDYTYSESTPNEPILQQGYLGNKDWYSVFGVYLSYKINYRAKCPAFD